MMISDVDEFFDTDDFAQSAVYTNPAGVETTIPVIFNSPFSVPVVPGTEFMSQDPSVHCRTRDVQDADGSCLITIDDVGYQVREVQPDGTGITVMLLTKN